MGPYFHVSNLTTQTILLVSHLQFDLSNVHWLPHFDRHQLVPRENCTSLRQDALDARGATLLQLFAEWSTAYRSILVLMDPHAFCTLDRAYDGHWLRDHGPVLDLPRCFQLPCRYLPSLCQLCSSRTIFLYVHVLGLGSRPLMCHCQRG